MKQAQDAAAELHDRCDWSLALIAGLVSDARRSGWLSGDAAPTIDANATYGRATADNSVTPMRLLASRLQLTNTESDLLWLLACIELDPHVATAAQLLVSPGMNELSAQMIERLVARGETLDEDVFERLERFALVLGLIHSRGRFTRGGYDGNDGWQAGAREACAATVYG